MLMADEVSKSFVDLLFTDAIQIYIGIYIRSFHKKRSRGSCN